MTGCKGKEVMKRDGENVSRQLWIGLGDWTELEHLLDM